MEICIRNSTGDRARCITQSQFKVLYGALMDMMNGGKKLKDDAARAQLEAAGDPMDFLPSVLMEVALYEDAPHYPFLGGWLGSDVERSQEVYNLARIELSDAEHSEFDMKTSVETQRTFMYLVAYAHGARTPYPLDASKPAKAPMNGALYYDAEGNVTETLKMDGRKFQDILISEAHVHGMNRDHASYEVYRGGSMIKGRTLITKV
jgi:hypothetical protein